MKITLWISAVMFFSLPAAHARIGAGCIGIPAADLELQVSVDRSLAPGLPEDPMDAVLFVTVVNQGDRKFVGELLIDFPQAKGGTPGRMQLVLGGGEERREPFTFHLPAGKPLEMEIVFSIESGGERLLTTNAVISKFGGFQVIGPFEGNTAEGLERVFPPEEGVDLDAVDKGMGGRALRWQAMDPDAVSPEGYHDLNLALGANENATAYAWLCVHAVKAMEGILHLGSDDGVKVWLNGELIHTHAVHRGSEPGQDRIPVSLESGRNVFLLKVCNDDGGWGFHFELKDEKGEPLSGVQREVGVTQCFIRDTELRVKEVGRTAALLTWKSDLPARSTVTWVEADRGRTLVSGGVPKEKMIRPDPSAEPKKLVEPMASTNHAVRLEGLKPGTRYLAWAEPALAGGPTPAIAFYTDPPEGFTQYLVLKLAALVFTATTPPADQDREGAMDPCPPEELERLRREMAQTVYFYWITSGMRLLLDVAYFVTDDYHPGTNEAYGVGYGERDEEVFLRVLEAAGRKVDEFDGRLFISMEKRWDEGSGRWVYPASGGGTIGPESEPGYGKSAWKGGSNNAWLFCHEFQHQLDALYHYSHGPEHLFNHFQPWDDTAHRHGEHWDGNAWIFLEWAGYVTREHPGRPYLEPSLGYRYFLSRWGRVVRSVDVDNDGIPDSDRAVPLDEGRFKSDPTKKDTDGDGLEDMMEVLASHGLEYGLDEIWAGEPASHRADPNRPDTDGDGLKDGADPYPIYPFDPEIPKGDPEHAFAAFRDRAFEGEVTVGWDDEFLHFGLETREAPEHVKLLLDLDDDGWFVGADNFDIRVRDGVVFEPRFHNCGVEGKWPFYEEGRLEVGRDVLFESEIEKDRFRLRVRLPRSPGLGLELDPGERVGMLLAVGPKGGNGRPGRQGSLTLFEPHTFFTFTLKE